MIFALGKLLRPVRAGQRRSPLAGPGFAADTAISVIPGHGPHHYRFHVFAVAETIPDRVSTAKALLARMSGHVLAHGVLTGTYERPDRAAPVDE